MASMSTKLERSARASRNFRGGPLARKIHRVTAIVEVLDAANLEPDVVGSFVLDEGGALVTGRLPVESSDEALREALDAFAVLQSAEATCVSATRAWFDLESHRLMLLRLPEGYAGLLAVPGANARRLDELARRVAPLLEGATSPPASEQDAERTGAASEAPSLSQLLDARPARSSEASPDPADTLARLRESLDTIPDSQWASPLSHPARSVAPIPAQRRSGVYSRRGAGAPDPLASPSLARRG